ncbi:hypothetical protein FACS1894188_05540 [Clostridia bacterium]|nr:hypothetical protein FACS1894188_05540 [Clostridia bacterium]
MKNSNKPKETDRQLVSVANNNNDVTSLESDIVKIAHDVVAKTDKKIQKGLDKPIASTGTPISELKGAAKFTSSLSNIGGGSKDTGGGGMEDGLKTINQNSAAKGILYGVETAKQNELSSSNSSLSLPNVTDNTQK